MNKTELIAAVAEQAGISKKDAEKALKAFADVVVEELIPEMSKGKHSHIGTICFALGFSLMMVLDFILG